MSGFTKVVAFSKWALAQFHKSHPSLLVFPSYFSSAGNHLPGSTCNTGGIQKGTYRPHAAAAGGFRKVEEMQLCCLSALQKDEDKASRMCCRNWEAVGRFRCAMVILLQHYEESPNGWLTVTLWCCAHAWWYLGKMQQGKLIKIQTWSFSICLFFFLFFFSSFSFPSLPFIFPLHYL